MLPPADLKEITLWFLRKRRRFRVSGHSLDPALQEGDEVLVKLIQHSAESKPKGYQYNRAKSYDRTTWRETQLHEDAIVVAEHPKRPGFLVVKQRDGKGLKSLCHKECGVDGARVLGVVTSIW